MSTSPLFAASDSHHSNSRDSNSHDSNGHRSVIRDPERLNRLDELQLLDTPSNPSLDRLTALAARLLAAPTALVSIVDDDRQFFKSAFGLGDPWAARGETPLSHSMCQHAMVSNAPLVVGDATKDVRFGKHLAVSQMGVASYLGVPLVTVDGVGLGALCVIDQRPRCWSDEQVTVLHELASLVMDNIGAQRTFEQLRHTEDEARRATAELKRANQLQRSIVEAIDADACVIDADGQVVIANRSWLEFVDGCPTDALATGLDHDLLDRIGRLSATRPEAASLLGHITDVIGGHRRRARSRYANPDITNGTEAPVAVTITSLRRRDRNMALVVREPCDPTSGGAADVDDDKTVDHARSPFRI